MKQQIIQAIKNFDINKLSIFLDDSKSYMDLYKSIFLKALEDKFNEAKKQGCNGFDKVSYGICCACNKGCEAITFISKSGFYLDLFIESKNNIDVDDIYTCSEIISSNIIEKKYSLEPHFYEDEKVTFYADSKYKFIKEQYKLMLSDINHFKENLSLKDFITWYDKYNDLRNLDFLETTLLKLYTKIYDAITAIDKIIEQQVETEYFVKSIKEAVSIY
ncbi:hypothetical protein [Polaribacter ponticola]|uniref:Uncharacterized protein n=1 Tax=Polaribacter ponticola TaxID=2978475 RepID=A0ABT5S506_9FLAO|nr:hypothetical protein [Polaribacter sp. MSW5]MDD7913194.1 hypothetical protein [Polaribacter sp. MSW5]